MEEKKKHWYAKYFYISARKGHVVQGGVKIIVMWYT